MKIRIINNDRQSECCKYRLEALSVNDGWAGFVVFGLGDPHLLEGGEGGQDGSADPDRIFALGRGHNLDFHCGRRQGSEFLGHALPDACEHRAAAREHNVAVQVLSDVHVTLQMDWEMVSWMLLAPFR